MGAAVPFKCHVNFYQGAQIRIRATKSFADSREEVAMGLTDTTSGSRGVVAIVRIAVGGRGSVRECLVPQGH